jgi:hypothetical protein
MVPEIVFVPTGKPSLIVMVLKAAGPTLNEVEDKVSMKVVPPDSPWTMRVIVPLLKDKVAVVLVTVTRSVRSSPLTPSADAGMAHAANNRSPNMVRIIGSSWIFFAFSTLGH